MKILLLSVYVISASFFQQDATSSNSATSAKRTDKTQQQRPAAQNSVLNASHAQPVQKQRVAKDANATASPLNSPAKVNTPKN